jgi:hypothetical protein
MSFSLSLMIGHRPPDRRQTQVCRTTKAPSPLRSAGALQIRLICFCLLFQPIAVIAQRRATITIDTSRATNRIVPSHALGAAIDGHEKGMNDLQLTPPNIQAMLSAGFKSLTYRLRTELAGDVWHWNPAGAWSDMQSKQGYWTSDAKLGEPISLSYGYSLPRRGNTIDQATNAGYSRIDDGDRDTFWKSNPYLDRRFTGEDNALHPQWIVIDFERPVPINAIQILWGHPFAETFRIQYGNFDDVSDIALNAPGAWGDFPSSVFTGDANRAPKFSGDTLRLSGNPINARWVRIVMTQSSGASAEFTNDVRDRVGFAVRELSAGVVDAQGNFHDRMRHGTEHKKQTIIYVSSTDPWHRDSDLHQDVEQVGLDRIYATGLTNDLPMLLPTGLLYDTPENAATEIRYLRERGYKFDATELGEEPDGQYVTPEDFGALYLQFARAIHEVDPQLKLGGPSLQEISIDEDASRANRGNGEWMRRFLDYLKRHGRAADFSFFSFEWYPFDEVCEATAPQLAQAPKLLDDALKEMQRRGVSRNIPWIISEYGYSAFAARAEIDIEGALLNADIIGKFLTLGGDQAFLFGYTPSEILREVPCTAGNNMLFLMDEDGKITHRFATYFGARLLTQEWLKPGDEVHEVYPASSDVRDADGNELISAYAVHRPDGLWSVLLINKDPKRAFPLTLVIKSAGGAKSFEGAADVYQYSPRQYSLGGSGMRPYPIRADEPEHRVTDASSPVSLPPYSLTIIRGKLK